VIVAKLTTLTACRRSDNGQELEAAGAGQSREAPNGTEGRIELRQRFRKMTIGASVRDRSR
jgi:hypothetical protein